MGKKFEIHNREEKFGEEKGGGVTERADEEHRADGITASGRVRSLL